MLIALGCLAVVLGAALLLAARLRALGATRQEVLEALLMTLPAAGFGPLSQCLPAAMAVFDAS